MSQIVRRARFSRVLPAAAIAAAAVSAGLITGTSAQAGEQSLAGALGSAKAPAAQLDNTRTVDLDGATFSKYQQRVGGVPVLSAELGVIDGPAMAPTVVADTTALGVERPATPKVSSASAIGIARAATSAGGNRAAPSSELAIDPAHGDALVQRVVLASKRPLKDFEVTVDATSGKVLAKRNLLKHATGTANLYTPNPVVTNNGYAGIGQNRRADHKDKDTALLTSLRTAVTLTNLDAGDCLVGTYVNSRLGKGKGDPVCRPGQNWENVTRHKDKFEALMGYYHIDTISAYIQSIGFTGPTNVHPGRITSLADNFPDDNSFYSPGDGKMHYGTGGVDDAEDGDVITHEFGHAIQDAQSPGFGTTDQAGSLGEGFGDFMSALNTFITPGVPDYQAAEYCIFDWDGTGGYGGPGVKPCGRLATGEDETDTFDDAKVTCSLGHGQLEVHCFGEVWAHGLIDLLNDIPPESGVPPIARDVLSSQFTYTTNESFQNAVNALVAADQALYSGTHVTAICTEMNGARGIPASACP